MLSALQKLGEWSPELLMQSLGEYFAYPILSMADLLSLRPDFALISYTQCVQRHLAVVQDTNGHRTLALGDPFDGPAEDWALHRCAVAACLPHIALTHPDDLQAFLAQQEQKLRAMDDFDVRMGTEKDEEVATVISLAMIGDDSSTVVKLVNSTIYDAIKVQASDIHLECDSGCLRVLYRIDGVLVTITQIEGRDLAQQVISRIKVMAELDIAESRIPQDGRFKIRINAREIDFRVSIMPNILGEDAVLRLLDRQALTEDSHVLSLDKLGLDDQTIVLIRQLATRPHGMLLVTGPTGSGKTTTLYAAITEIHSGRDKVVTIEDPVEYRLPRVLQIPVNEKKGLSFARGLRSILRHDPDKIMIGEIRDGETAQIAVQAALTGHLVFTTVHANNVFDVLGRFLHMGVDAYSFTAALNGIVAQRLLRINCRHCVAAANASADQLAMLGLTSAQIADWNLRSGAGCRHCRGVGYRGRHAVAEVLLFDDPLREMVVDRVPISTLKQRALQSGLRPLHDSALHMVRQGETSIEEVLRVTG